MKKIICIFTFISALMIAGCNKYEDSIKDLEGRLDTLENYNIPTLDEQVTKIRESLDALIMLDSSLKQLIDNLNTKAHDLQQQLDDNAYADAAAKKELQEEIYKIKSLISALQEKDAELESKIEDLKNYVDNEISATQDWATATFATLLQYESVQTDIAEIKALIIKYKSEITTDIENAIAESEVSMKKWVNKILADGYYDIAEIEAKLSALESELLASDDILAKEITAQQAALEQARKDLTSAYKNAITDAIEANNGVINQMMAETIKVALDKVNLRLAVIDNDIAAIRNDLESIKSHIASIDEQIASISLSLYDLNNVDTKLESLIANLSIKASDLQQQLDDNAYADAAVKKELQEEISKIKSLISALQEKDSELESKIEDLKN